MKYDSTEDVMKHQNRVSELIEQFWDQLRDRMMAHDESKLEEPEKSCFDQVTMHLKGLTYGSDEYNACLAELKPALDHHYQNNRHHPEHFGALECNGCFKLHPRGYDKQCDVCGYGQFTWRPDVGQMNLIDIVEMLMDWKAASERHDNGDIFKSIEINTKRFGLSDQLRSILFHTAKGMGW